MLQVHGSQSNAVLRGSKRTFSIPFSPKSCTPVAKCMTKRMPVVKATALLPKEKPAVAQFAESIGLPTDEGLFGFKPFSELWCGRLAMMGFIISIVEECVTGKGTLGQIGFTDTPSIPLLIGLLVLFGGATAAATVWTGLQVAGKKLSKKEIGRYKQFLGLTNDKDWEVEALAMKKRGDFTSPGIDSAAIEEARQQGMAADAVLGVATSSGRLETNEQASTSSVAEAASTRAQQIEESMFQSDELKYARAVELDNGRWAMVGFLAAVLVEAGTGKGIVMQIIMYLKWSGLLGPMSGF